MTNLAYPHLYIQRKEHGHNQAFVASKLGISKERYSLKELNKANFTLPEAKILSELYGISIDDLFSSSIAVGQ
ncbi:helix-turn-helix transcriptional regulator [Staphylococcus xylosus]|uniref:helix-turn-helix transcriptional regulator n=1 Tax=Staphylococcus xylosus TaxID=1288 RepID=UPI001AADD46A|nr:helix-turn-helix transcriptional regulator [Staphylococcus xylosus]MBO3075387.1 helix-turn-helix transcriptional regulator [Staphylococcus xylosus]MEB7765760.1 helix-turn-helix domain-containing protein [Staphylococcus xylosus]